MDSDGDGYGSSVNSNGDGEVDYMPSTDLLCDGQLESDNGNDCDDNNADAYPTAEEIMMQMVLITIMMDLKNAMKTVMVMDLELKAQSNHPIWNVKVLEVLFPQIAMMTLLWFIQVVQKLLTMGSTKIVTELMRQVP